jgi:hypothetical protein
MNDEKISLEVRAFDTVIPNQDVQPLLLQGAERWKRC